MNFILKTWVGTWGGGGGQIRPDIFYFSSFKNPDRIFQEMEQNKILNLDFYCPPYENCAESEKNTHKNWVRNYILLCKERSPWEKSLI